MSEDTALREITSTKYLRFVRTKPAGRKTPIVDVISRSSGIALGQILWFGRWRQFCFFPLAGTAFNTDCMEDIQDKITELRKERE